MIAKRDHNFFWGSFRFRIFFLLMIMGLLPLLAGSEMIKRSYRSSIIDQKLSELRYTCQTVAGQMSGNSLAEVVDDEMTQELNFLAEYCGGRLLLVDSSYRILFDTYGVTQNKYCISGISDNYREASYRNPVSCSWGESWKTSESIRVDDGSCSLYFQSVITPKMIRNGV